MHATFQRRDRTWSTPTGLCCSWRTTRIFDTSLLKAFGYAVVAAAGGSEALDRLRAGTAPCLIVLDLEMPRKDGSAFRYEQTHDPKLAPIPTISRRNVKQKAALLGIDGYFEKRDGFDGLLDLVARYSLTE